MTNPQESGTQPSDAGNEVLAVVLAAGQGRRMNSDLPKVLCTAHGRPLIDYVIDALHAADIRRIVAVVGYRHEQVREALAPRGVEFAHQQQQLGTGHAVQMCARQIEAHRGPVIVLAGDSPMVQPSTLRALLEVFRAESPACLLGTLDKPDPTGLGRIVRDADGAFVGIVEERDADPRQRRITEVNMSTYVFDSPELLHSLDRLGNQNQQGEYYLTDCPGILRAEGKRVLAKPLLQDCESLSVNTPAELKVVEQAMSRLGYDAANRSSTSG